MNIQQQLCHEIEMLPLAIQEKVLEVVHALKTTRDTPLPSKSTSNQLTTLADLDLLALDTGINDLASQHDHYLYGLSKR